MANTVDLAALNKSLSGKGDVAFIATHTGYNISYIRKVLSGHRSNKKVLQAARLRMQYNTKCARAIQRIPNNKAQ